MPNEAISFIGLFLDAVIHFGSTIVLIMNN